MVEGIVTVCTLSWVQNQELVNQVQSVRVFDIGFESVLHLPFLAFGQLHFLVQLVLLIHTRPHLRKEEDSVSGTFH